MTAPDLFQLWHILGGTNGLVKESHQHGLEAVQVGAVVDSLVVQHQVHQEQGIPLWPATQSQNQHAF